MSISGSKAVVAGSWSITSSNSNAMNPIYLLQLRLHKWQQQVDTKETTEACFDWVIKNEKGQLRHYAIVKLYGQHVDLFHNSTFLEDISNVLEEQNELIVGIKNVFDLAIAAR